MSNEPDMHDWIKLVEDLVMHYGVELDIFAWERVKESALRGELKESKHE